jgi:dTDP-4-amino-4,6-dideoxygalactose transaminase
MSSNPHQITRQFEAELCEYTGAPYAVAVNSCTMAILLACAYLEVGVVRIPKRTYVSVPMSIIHAGGDVEFEDLEWSGAYRLKPYPVFDAARRFTSNMFRDTGDPVSCHKFICVSFHASKILGLEQGGAILHGSSKADSWLRRARFDGRAEGVAPADDTFRDIGWHCYMSPSVAAQGVLKLHSLPRVNPDLPNDAYPDLSTLECFK